MNAVTVYTASKWGNRSCRCRTDAKRFRNVFAPLASLYNASPLYFVTYAWLMYLIAYAVYRKGWFLRV